MFPEKSTFLRCKTRVVEKVRVSRETSCENGPGGVHLALPTSENKRFARDVPNFSVCQGAGMSTRRAFNYILLHPENKRFA